MTPSLAQLHQAALAALRNPFDPASVLALEALVAAEPKKADHWFNLGYVQRMQGRYADALRSYQQALDLGIAGAEEVHLNRAVILSEFLDDPASAARELQLATAMHPAFVPAWLNAALLHEDEGNTAGAATTYRHVLSLAPDHPEAIARLARIEPPAGEQVDAVRRVLGRGGLDPLMQADLWFALASQLDRLGDYDQAFHAASKANLLAAVSIPPAQRYDPAKGEALVSALMASRIEVLDDAATDWTPVFVCGMFRSGSTLLEAMLGRHQAITAGGERDMLPRYFGGTDLTTLDEKANSAHLYSARTAYIEGLAHLHLATPYITDKRPDNIAHMLFAKAMFPNAKLVMTRRNALDNLISCYFLNFAADVPYAVDLDHIAHWTVQVDRLTTHWQQRYAGDGVVVDYEALVADPRAQLAPVLESLGLPWQDSCIDPATPLPATRTPSSIQIRQNLYTSSVGRWQNYAQHLSRQHDWLHQAGLVQ